MDEKKIIDLENRLNTLEQSSGRNTGSIDKRVASDAVADEISNILWNNISFTSSFATASITTTSPSTTELLDANGRESDTSQGRRFKPNRPSKFRCSFYLDFGTSQSTIYIASPAVMSTATIGTSITESTKSFVGIKIVAGAVSASSSVAGVITNIATGITILEDITNVLEIQYYITHATILFNGAVIGDISCNLLATTLETFLPFLITIKSGNGNTTNLTMESFEFIQNRN